MFWVIRVNAQGLCVAKTMRGSPMGLDLTAMSSYKII